jgi:hypothetical protein
MKILLSTKSKKNDEYYNRLPPATMVKRIGDYLVNNLVDAKKLREEPNKYELVFDMMHMLPEDLRRQMKEYQQITTDFDPDILYIDNLYVSIVTYSNSIWAYITIEHSTDNHIGAGPEKTIGTMKFKPEDLISLPYCKDKLLNYMVKKVQREFKKFDISEIRDPNYRTRR